MSEQAAGSNVARTVLEENKRNTDEEKASGTDDERTAEEVKVRTSCTTVLDLIDDCWRVVLDYLDVGDQLSFASSNESFEHIFQRYASHRYKHLDESMTSKIGYENLEQLLQSVGEDLVSYECGYSSTTDQQLWLLRRHCSQLQHLKITIRGTTPKWDHLYSLTKLKSLDAYLDMCSSSMSTDFVHNLKQLKCLRQLKLDAFNCCGEGLCVLDQLESLDVRNCDEFDVKYLVDCCQAMKKLRHLDFGIFEYKSKNSFEIMMKNCQQLEILGIGLLFCDLKVPYELVCQLPRLKHLKVGILEWGSLRDSFIEGLINKQGSPLESLILEEENLPEKQIKRICDISTLKELRILCDTVPLKDLLKLKNLLYLHIVMPITIDQILALLKGLPRLRVLNLQYCDHIHFANFLTSIRTWVSDQREQRKKIQIYLDHPATQHIVYAYPLVEIIETDSNIYPILIKKELGERDQM